MGLCDAKPSCHLNANRRALQYAKTLHPQSQTQGGRILRTVHGQDFSPKTSELVWTHRPTAEAVLQPQGLMLRQAPQETVKRRGGTVLSNDRDLGSVFARLFIEGLRRLLVKKKCIHPAL